MLGNVVVPIGQLIRCSDCSVGRFWWRLRFGGGGYGMWLLHSVGNKQWVAPCSLMFSAVVCWLRQPMVAFRRCINLVSDSYRSFRRCVQGMLAVGATF